MINCRKIWLFETTLSDPFFIGAKDGITCTMTDQNTIDVLDITSVMYRMNSVVKGSVEYSPTYGGEAVNPVSFYGRNQYSFSLQFNLPLYDADNLSLIWGRSYAVIWEQNDGIKKCVFGQFKSQRLTVDNLYIQRVTIDSGKTNTQIYDVTTLSITDVVNEITCFNSPFSPPDDPQPTPTNLTAVANLGDIDLSWDDNSTTETGFQIERSLTSGSGFSIINTTLPSVSTYKDTTVIGGIEYFYRVKALGVVDSSYSNEATDTALLAFTTTWKTDNAGTSASDSISLPLSSSQSYNIIVDWGDGDVDNITQWDQPETTHQYDSVGTKEVVIYGLVNFEFLNSDDKEKILTISKWGSFDFATASSFWGCSNLTVLAVDTPSISTTTFADTFRSCSSLDNIPSLSSWDFSLITSLQRSWQDCVSFDGTGLNSLDIGSVTTLEDTWRNCDALNLSLNSLNVSNVTTFARTFSGSAIWNGDLTSWNVSSGQIFTQMFQSCPQFNQNIGGWSTVSATQMTQMFNSASIFNQNIGGWDVSGVGDFSGMFKSASSFNQDISSWLLSASNISLAEMFRSAGAFNQLLTWDTTNVVNMSFMFASKQYNQDITGTNKWVMDNVTNIAAMFFSNPTFDQDISLWDTPNITSLNSLFQTSTINQDLGALDINSVTSANGFLDSNGNLTTANLDAILIGFAAQAPSIQSGVVFSAVGINNNPRSAASDAAVTLLTGTYGWTISTEP